MVKFNFTKIDKLNTPYPLISLDKFLDKNTCAKLCEEINNFKEYDDLVMNGRFRVNKGSNHFEKQLKQSPPNLIFQSKLKNPRFKMTASASRSHLAYLGGLEIAYLISF